jgi:uncharacterized membrane protein YdbT with pleckstrin-like domain
LHSEHHAPNRKHRNQYATQATEPDTRTHNAGKLRAVLLGVVTYRGPGFSRRVLIGTIIASVAITVIATVVLTAMALTAHGDTANKLAAAGDVMVGATLLLAIIAALVALLAYAVSTGLPDLQVSIKFDLLVRVSAE